MTIQEAQKIIEDWKRFVEIADKLSKISFSWPESLLPYPSEVIEEAMNIIAKYYFDSGDKKKSQIVQDGVMNFLICFKPDEEAINSLNKKLKMISENSELKKITLENLEEARDSWRKHRAHKNPLNVEK